MHAQNFGTWSTDSLQLQRTAAWLPELSVIEVTGKDAVDFVHGQLTNSIKNIGSSFRLAAYCQPQGRILSLMRIFKRNDALYLVMAQDLLEGFMKRFSMFILRSDVTLRVADEMAVAGVIAPEMALPAMDEVRIEGNVAVARVADADDHQRAMLVGEKSAIDALVHPNDDAGLWFVSDVMAGLPWVGLSTKEAFIPQWINLDLVGGVVFNKGCYPGQEVISRVQHIGTTPRRMYRAKIEKAVTLKPNEDIFVDALPAGNVVMSVTSADQTIALVEITKEAAATGSVQIQGETFAIAE